MLYNLLKNKNYMLTAGKITIATAVSGILIFAFIFLFNAGKTELMKVEAQGGQATTTLIVLNTPPDWIQFAIEQFESSTSSPTNSGSQVSWTAVANDPNQTTYYLLICSTNATPTSINSAAPACSSGIQWGVSTATPINTPAYVSTTTQEASPFSQGNNNWYAWVCDGASSDSRCNASSSQGVNATNSSPFVVNYRPVFDIFADDSPADPGATVNFTSSSTDPDGNTMRLFVCATAGFSTSTNNCTGTNLASTTVPTASNPGASYTLPSVIRDQNYAAFGYLIDEFNHHATGTGYGFNSVLTVSNVAPTVASSTISLNGGLPMSITTQAGETPNFTLSFEVRDNNSCRNNNASTTNNFEITGFVASVLHATSSNSCSPTVAGDYDPNDCYTSAVATTTWNLNCVASTTSCGVASTTDPTMYFDCTFPLWYVTNPTDPGSPFETDDWKAYVAGIDDNATTGPATLSQNGVEVDSATYMELLNASIPYGQLEPGENSGSLNASTTIRSVGNTGLDQNFSGFDMCGTFSATNTCPVSSTSTIPADQQRFGSSSLPYASGVALSTSTKLFELDIPKPTSTTTPSSKAVYWGIAVPGQITLAGAYTGLNTFGAVTSF